MLGWDRSKWDCKELAVKVKSRSGLTVSRWAFQSLSAFLLLLNGSNACLQRWWVIPAITKDGSKWGRIKKKHPSLTFQRYSSQVHCICVEKCYCASPALFGKVARDRIQEGGFPSAAGEERPDITVRHAGGSVACMTSRNQTGKQEWHVPSCPTLQRMTI